MSTTTPPTPSTSAPIAVPAADSARWRRKRCVARRIYGDLSRQLDQTLQMLAGIEDADQRAEVLQSAADQCRRLATWHPLAYGLGGRPAPKSLIVAAELLLQVAATEHAVVLPAPDTAGPVGGAGELDPELPDSDPRWEAALWVDLAHTADPHQRAVLLAELHDRVADRLGVRAAAVLLRLRDIEAARAGISPVLLRSRPATRPNGIRVAIGAVFAALGALIALSSLPMSGGAQAAVAALVVTAAAVVIAADQLAGRRRR